MLRSRIVISALALSLAAWGCRAAPLSSEGQFTSSGLTLHYKASGKGTPLVALAGGPGLGPSYMQALVKMLSKHHKVFLLEQRGTGRSIPTETSSATLNESLAVEDIERLRQAIGHPKIIVLGHSFGTLTAMEYTIAHPTDVKTLILIATMPPRLSESTLQTNVQKRLSASAKQEYGKLMRRYTETHVPAARNALAVEMNGLLAPAYVYDDSKATALNALIAHAGLTPETAELMNASVGNYDLTKKLQTLSVPTLIIQGAADPLDETVATKTRDAIPGAKLDVIAKSGHFPWVEAPKAVNSALEDFFRRYEEMP